MTRAAIGFIGAIIFAFGVLTLMGGRHDNTLTIGAARFLPRSRW